MSAELSRGENPGTPAEHDVPAARGRASVPAQQPDPAGPVGRPQAAGEAARPHPEPVGGQTRRDAMDAAEQARTMEQQPDQPAGKRPEKQQDEPDAPQAGQQPGQQAEPEEQPAAHDPHDRAGARALFVELRGLPEGSPERAELRNQLVRMHLPLVEHLARRFRNRGEPLDDLTQVATIGLIKSVDRFDVDRGVEFSTYATPTVVGEIKRHFRDKGWAVRVPRRLQELRLALTTATGELSQRHGRAPTVHELAEHLKISEEEVLEGLESANAYSTLSLDVPDTDDESPAVADTLGSEDEALEGVEYRESLKPLLEQLPPREKTILLLRFFGNMTQSQIAQEVGISQMHVSRLLARTLAQLRDKLLIEE
ncbi:SigB/SigF/SigG family RNA polymerase sigma factor [Streptomyces sp. NPDC049040]|uniref:RNA polymerase sigma factor SigF n=1 Tax=Streptomyces sp. NPDC049040 TaxID=3365593 RepID=UPI003720A513